MNIMLNDQKLIDTIAQAITLVLDNELDDLFDDETFAHCLDLITALNAIGAYDESHKYSIDLLKEMRLTIKRGRA